MTEPLQYQTPREMHTKLRESVRRHATGNGGGLLFFAVVFGVATWLSQIFGPGTGLFFGATAAAHFLVGILYIIAGTKLIKRNPNCERFTVAIACSHLIGALLLAAGVFFFPIKPAAGLPGLHTFECVLASIYAGINTLASTRAGYLAVKLVREP